MTTLVYDNSLEGFLSAVFEAYERKMPAFRIRKQADIDKNPIQMFSDVIHVVSDKSKASRVWKGLKARTTSTSIDYLYCAHLSELPESDDLMQAFVQHVFSNQDNIERDFSNQNVIRLAKVTKMVHRERHRMKAFIRFQLTGDGLYYAAIEPDFNVIPLIISHFKNRYADQRWLIYDLKRKYGAYYNLSSVENVTIDFTEGNRGGKDVSVSFDEKEVWYQQIWQDYFKSVNIASRKNLQLHLRHVPRRYWWLLTEKRIE